MLENEFGSVFHDSVVRFWLPKDMMMRQVVVCGRCVWEVRYVWSLCCGDAGQSRGGYISFSWSEHMGMSESTGKGDPEGHVSNATPNPTCRS